jgi:hypothetical protein
MTQLKLMLNGALFTLAFGLIVTLMVLVMSDMQPVQADLTINLAPAVESKAIEYVQLTSAEPQRDITQQRLAPLEVLQ